MRKFLPAILLALVTAAAASAQKTTVTATIVDPQGIPYANGSVSAQLVPAGVIATVSGAQIGGFVGPAATNDNGSFSMDLFSNPSISPAGTAWVFTVCNPGVPSPLGFGNVCFNSTPLTISGATLDISSTLNALALPLTHLGGAPASFPRWDQILNPNTNFAPNFGGVSANFTNGTISFAGMNFIFPQSSGCAASALNTFCEDTTAQNVKLWNGADNAVALLPAASSFTDGDVLGISISSGKQVLQDLGSVNGTNGFTFLTPNITDAQLGDALCITDLGPPLGSANCTPGQPPVTVSATSYAYDGSERGEWLIFTNASAKTATIGQASDPGVFNANWYTTAQNVSATNLVITATTSLFNRDDGTSGATLTVPANTLCSFTSDPSGSGNYYSHCSSVSSGGGGAPTNANYVLGVANGSLTNATVFFDLVNSPDVPPSSPNAMDDEMNAAAGAINSGLWTAVNMGTATANYSGTGYLDLNSPALGSNSLTLEAQTLPAAPWAFAAKISCASIIENFHNCGMALRESGTAKAVIFGYQLQGSGFTMITSSYTNSTTFNTPRASFTGGYTNSGYFCVQRSGTTLSYWFSTDGKAYAAVDSSNLTRDFTTAPDQVALVGNSSTASSATDSIYWWFRRKASNTCN